MLQQPLPTECRDTVTGNPFFHGCVDELTWFFEAKCAWIAALAMLVAFITVSILFWILTYYWKQQLIGCEEQYFLKCCTGIKMSSRFTRFPCDKTCLLSTSLLIRVDGISLLYSCQNSNAVFFIAVYYTGKELSIRKSMTGRKNKNCNWFFYLSSLSEINKKPLIIICQITVSVIKKDIIQTKQEYSNKII